MWLPAVKLWLRLRLALVLVLPLKLFAMLLVFFEIIMFCVLLWGLNREYGALPAPQGEYAAAIGCADAYAGTPSDCEPTVEDPTELKPLLAVKVELPGRELLVLGCEDIGVAAY